MQRSVVHRTDARIAGAGGGSLHRRSWRPPLARRAIALIHGYAEHVGRYDALGAWFAARGVAVHGYDQRGHGRSEGRRGHLNAFGELLDDAERFLEVVRQEHPGLPLTLLGHSLGGLVVASLLTERRPAVDDAVFSGAALARPEISGLRIAVARALRRVVPRLALASGIDPSGLSRDAAVVRDYLADPLVFGHMTCSFAVEVLDAIERLAARSDPIELPLLVLHGADDPIVRADASRRFFARARGPGSELRLYPKLLHEIFNEPEREDVFDDVLEWLDAREVAGG